MTTTDSDRPYSQLPGSITWRDETPDSFSDDEIDAKVGKQPAQGGAINEADRWAAGLEDGQMMTQALTRRQKKQRKRLEAEATDLRPDRQGRAIRRSAAAALPDSEGRRLAQWSNAGQRTKAFQRLADLLGGFDFADPTTQMKRGPTLQDDAEEQRAASRLRKETHAKASRTTEPTRSREEHRARSMVLFLVQKKYAKELGVSVKQYRQEQHPEDNETVEQLRARLEATAHYTSADVQTRFQLNTGLGYTQLARRSRILHEDQKKTAQVPNVAPADYKLNERDPEDQETLEELRTRLQGMQQHNYEPQKKTRARNRKKLGSERGFSEDQTRPDRQVKSRPDRNTVRTRKRQARKRNAKVELLTADKKARETVQQELGSQEALCRPEPMEENGECNDLDVKMETTILKDNTQDSVSVKLEYEME